MFSCLIIQQPSAFEAAEEDAAADDHVAPAAVNYRHEDGQSCFHSYEWVDSIA